MNRTLNKIYLVIFLLIFIMSFLDAKIDSKNLILDSGMKVLLVNNPKIPLVNIVLGVNIGSKDETEEINGWVHLFEHLVLFSGTKNKTNDNILSEIREKGGYINAHTDREFMTFELSLPSSHTQFGLDIMKEKVFCFQIEEAILKREKKAVEYELKQILNDPSQVASSIVFENVFINHPYRFPSYGKIEVVKKAKINELMKFYDNYFKLNNCSLVIIGNIDIIETEKKILELFNIVSDNKIVKQKILYKTSLKKNIKIKKQMDIEKSHIAFGFFAPNYNSEDFAALRMLTHIIGGGSNALLKIHLYRKKIFPVGFSMKYLSLKYGGIIIIDFSIESKMVKKAKSKVINFLKNMRKIKFSIKDYLPRNRRYANDLLIKGKNHFRFKTEEFKEKGLDTAISLARYLLLDSDKRKRVKKLHEVISKDLRRVAKTYFSQKYIFVEIKGNELNND